MNLLFERCRVDLPLYGLFEGSALRLDTFPYQGKDACAFLLRDVYVECLKAGYHLLQDRLLVLGVLVVPREALA